MSNTIATQTDNMWEVIEKLNDEYDTMKEELEEELQTANEVRCKAQKDLHEANELLDEADEWIHNMMEKDIMKFAYDFGQDEGPEGPFDVGYNDWDVGDGQFTTGLENKLAKRILPESIKIWNGYLERTNSSCRLKFFWDWEGDRIIDHMVKAVKRPRYPNEPLHL
jgi:hypothetical protein